MRLGKTAFEMDKIRLRTFEAFPKLMLILTITTGCLSWPALKQPSLIEWLRNKHPGQRKIKFTYYSLLNWPKRHIHALVTQFPSS